jgi:hypothetical protein
LSARPPHPLPLALLVAALVALLPASAVAKRPTAPPPAPPACATADQFEQPFGDGLNYVLVPGGSFEGSVWKPGMRVAENEPWFVHGASDRRSLGFSTAVVSPATCIGLLDPTLRFFARQVGGTPSALGVQARFVDALGLSHSVPLVAAPDATQGGWVRSAPIPIFANVLAARPAETGSFDPGQGPPIPTGTVQFAFVPAAGTSWLIDDVYVDPYRRN